MQQLSWSFAPTTVYVYIAAGALLAMQSHHFAPVCQFQKALHDLSPVHHSDIIFYHLPPHSGQSHISSVPQIQQANFCLRATYLMYFLVSFFSPFKFLNNNNNNNDDNKTVPIHYNHLKTRNPIQS